MGSYGARIFIPPYANPIRPFADPLVWREMQWYGAHMANLEEQAGLSGILNYGQYSGWGHFGWHWITPFHNIAGMLSESASAKLATPLYISHDELVNGANARNYQSAEASTIFPDPGQAGGGTCATSSTGRRPPPGVCWISRRATARWWSGTPT